MKKKIELSALLLFAGASLFAAAPAKPTSPNTPSIKRMIVFSPLPSERGVEIKLKNNVPEKAIVMIYDWNNDVIWKDALSPKKGLDRGFILNELDNGNYTVEVLLNKQMVKRTAHVYYKGDTKLVALRG